MSWLRPALFGIALLAAGFLIGRYLPQPPQIGNSETSLFDQTKQTSLINPLLACAEPSATLPRAVNAVSSEAQAYIDSARASGRITAASLSFRDLNNGPRFGIAEDERFSPGSLLKVPLMMAILRESQTTPGLLDTEIEFVSGDAGVAQEISSEGAIVPGNRYLVRDLLSAMIISSDNNAAALLFELLGPEKVTAVYGDLGIAPPVPGQDTATSVRGYSIFFRLLYNSTYLTQENSAYALDLLTRAAFKDGLAAGVPPGTLVAHKFGERGGIGGEQQLHDCGIVYSPSGPYVLCIMTRGRSLEELKTVVADLSKIVYDGLRS